MRAWPVALLLLTSLLAGCTGDDDPSGGQGDPPSTPPTTGNGGDPDEPDPEPATEVKLLTQFTFDGCDGVRFLYLMDPADAASLLPEGYTPSLWSNTQQLPLDQAQQAQLEADLYQCSSFTAGSYAFENVTFGVVYLGVEPPEDAVEADAHGYILQMVGGEDVLSAIWPVAGYPSHNGTVTFEDLTAAQTAAAGDYRWDVATTAPGTGGGSGSFTWYHELEDTGDRLTWTGTQDIPAGTGGAASLSYPGDAPFAGLEPVQGQPLPGQGSAVDSAAFTSMDLVKELAAGRQ